MPHSDRTKGLALAALGGLALSFDIPLIRLSGGDLWSVQFVRGLMIAPIGIVAWLLLRQFGGYREPMLPGRLAWPIALLYATSSALFFFAVFNTSTANLVFILAFNPMIAALFGWLLMKERPAPQTFLAMAVMLIGVYIIVRDGLAAGNWQGDFAALVSAAAIAGAITLSRASGRNHGFTVMISQLGPVLLSIPVIISQGVSVPHFSWMVLNGALLLPLAFFCLAAAPRYIGGAESAMFYLLETVLAPVWVWLVFAEKPTVNAITGGMILLGALAAHTIWELRRERELPAPSSPV
ncbi:MAG: EamA family transporter [Rhizobiaceae bacterium]